MQLGHNNYNKQLLSSLGRLEATAAVRLIYNQVDI